MPNQSIKNRCNGGRYILIHHGPLNGRVWPIATFGRISYQNNVMRLGQRRCSLSPGAADDGDAVSHPVGGGGEVHMAPAQAGVQDKN